jgi:hypothetical protein
VESGKNAQSRTITSDDVILEREEREEEEGGKRIM